MTIKTITPPWTDAQVHALNRWQRSGWVHPFTCGKRDEHPDNEGVLVAGVYGWTCPARGCDYEQKWAHEMMLNVPPNPFEVMSRTYVTPEGNATVPRYDTAMAREVAKSMRDIARNWGFPVCLKAAELIELMLESDA